MTPEVTFYLSMILQHSSSSRLLSPLLQASIMKVLLGVMSMGKCVEFSKYLE